MFNYLYKIITGNVGWMFFGALFEGEGGGAGAGQEGDEGGEGAGQGSLFNDLATKKGYKTPDDMAKSYIDGEKEMGRRQSVIDSVKTQLDGAGYEMDDKGAIKQKQGVQTPQTTQYPQQTQQIPQPQQQYDEYGNPIQQQQPEVFYDLNNQPITNPIDRQLAQMSLSQRSVYVTNAILDQREQQQTAAFKHDQEVLSKPEAKGFENDVRNVMLQVPLAERANKVSWDNALLRVKGMRYDQAVQNAGQDGVNQFINKDNAQGVGGQGTGGGGKGKLTPEQRTAFNWYQTHKPGMFKDEEHFASRW